MSGIFTATEGKSDLGDTADVPKRINPLKNDPSYGFSEIAIQLYQIIHKEEDRNDFMWMCDKAKEFRQGVTRSYDCIS